MSAPGFTPIQLYRSATPGAVPSAGNLAAGELALNTADQRLFFKNSSNVVVSIGTGNGTVTSVSGTGTVNGITLTGTVTSSGSLTLGGTLSGVDLATQTSGTLSVSRGGTGATTLTGVVKGNGTSAFTAGTVGLTSEVSGILPIANGGTNSTATPTAGGVTYGTGTAQAYTSAGTTGQVLTSNGSSAPTWSSPATGGILADPRTLLTFKAVSWATTITGVVGTVNLTATTQLIIAVDNTVSTFYGTVYDSSTDTMGAPVAIATSVANNGWLSVAKLSSTSVLIGYVSTNATTFSARVLSISGTTLTANTAATASVSGGARVMGDPALLGSTYVFCVGSTANPGNYLIGATVSGTTVTLGTPASFTAAADGAVALAYRPVVGYTSTTGVVAYRNTDTFIHFVGFSVSGTTITIGSDVSSGANSSAVESYHVLSSGRVMFITSQGATSYQLAGHLVGLSGTTPSVSATFLNGQTSSSAGASSLYYAFSSGNNVLVASSLPSSTSFSVVVVRDNSGAIAQSASTDFAITTNAQNLAVLAPASATSIIFANLASGNDRGIAYTIGISGTAPAITARTAFSGTQNAATASLAALTVSNIISIGGAAGGLNSLTLNGNSFFAGGILGTSGRYYPVNRTSLAYAVNTSTADIPAVLMKLQPLFGFAYDTTITGGAWYATTLGLYRVQFA